MFFRLFRLPLDQRHGRNRLPRVDFYHLRDAYSIGSDIVALSFGSLLSNDALEGSSKSRKQSSLLFHKTNHKTKLGMPVSLIFWFREFCRAMRILFFECVQKTRLALSARN